MINSCLNLRIDLLTILVRFFVSIFRYPVTLCLPSQWNTSETQKVTVGKFVVYWGETLKWMSFYLTIYGCYEARLYETADKYRICDEVKHYDIMDKLLLELFTLVVKQKWNAVRNIKWSRNKFKSDIDYYIRFDFYKKGNWEESCDCWYVHEYFEYCSKGRIVKTLFDRIVDNIKQGHCPHTIGQPEVCITSTGVHLIHAACAVNNKEAVKYMLQDDVLLFLVRTTCARLTPAVVAVLKDSSDVIKSVSAPLFSTGFKGRHDSTKGQTMRWVSRDPDTEELTKVTVEHFQKCSDQHPFVWCFFLNVIPSKKTIKEIVPFVSYSDIHIILGHVIHAMNGKTATEIVTNFSQHISIYDPDLALQCVLWNKPEVLQIVLSRSGNIDISKRRYSGFSLQSLAEFLCHSECVGVLEAFKQCMGTTNKGILQAPFSRFLAKLEQHTYNTGARNVSPYTCLVFIYKLCQYSFNCESLCQLLSKVSENNFDVNQQDDDGLTVLHVILLAEVLEDIHCLESVFDTICRLGADVNVEDNEGRNALDIAMTESPNFKFRTSSDRLRVFKLVLSHNPVPSLNSKAVTNAVERDCLNALLQFLDYEPVRVVLVKADEKGVPAETARDKYLALSFVAILLELGFTVKQCEIESFGKLPSALRCYLIETVSTPLPLKARCRNVIRETFPGPKLWRLLNVIKIPRLIVDIILFRPYLHHTKITDMNNVELPCR